MLRAVFPAGTSSVRAGSAESLGSVGAECAPFEGGWRTLRTHRPDPAVTPEMQRRSGGKRWEKLSQRIMSGERRTLRVCQLSHYVCRDCIRSFVLVSNGEIGGCIPYYGVGIVGRGMHAGGRWNYPPALGEAEGRHKACPYSALRGRRWLRCYLRDRNFLSIFGPHPVEERREVQWSVGR